MADALRKSGEQMQDREAWLAKLIERGASELSSLADTLRGNDIRALFGRLQTMAHEQPRCSSAPPWRPASR